MQDNFEFNIIDEEVDICMEGDFPAPKRHRPFARATHISREDLWNSPWGITLKESNVDNIRTSVGATFRLRFRVPYSVFTDILVSYCTKNNIFDKKYQSRIPIEFKILVSLSMLARGHDIDTVEEFSLIPRSTCLTIFHKFLRNYCYRLFHYYVFVPQGPMLQKTMDTYKRMGFNDSFGSIDCTHVMWNDCPERWKNFCIGKEKRPTLAFSV